MSLHVNFEPHSWYKGFAIQSPTDKGASWWAYTDNGNTYYVDEIKAGTLKELKLKITEYRSK